MILGEDDAARSRALTDHAANLLVEAGAGTGKTSLLAGRVCLMLGAGVPARQIAAITFTEAAASELGERVHGYLRELIAGRVPRPLEAVLPTGAGPSQTRALELAAEQLDELTITTIHGFCQTLIRNYAVEADLDPGAAVIDRDAKPVLFDRVFDDWLQRRLTMPPTADDPISVLSRDDPRGFQDRLRALARLRDAHRSARPAVTEWNSRPDIGFTDAARDFLLLITDSTTTAGSQWREDVQRLASDYSDAFAPPPAFERLWALAHPPRLPSMRPRTFDLARPRDAGACARLFGIAGELRSERLWAAMERLDEAYRAMMGGISGALMSRLSDALDTMLTSFAEHKRSAALMDFDDLLESACRLLTRHSAVRAALAERFPRLLVDEFQDTDQLQCDILFRLGAQAPVVDWRAAVLRPGALFLVGDPKQSLYGFRGAEVATYQAAKSVLQAQPHAAVVHVTRNFRSVEVILQHVNRCFERPLNASKQPGYVALRGHRTQPRHDLPCVAKLSVPTTPVDRIGDLRDAEAARVADACSRLLGGLTLRSAGGDRPLKPGDIGLLAPAATDLWRYEHALRLVGLPFVSEAGRALFQRQEAQDFVALVRTLADPADTLALGALLRGPLIGVTDQALLDASAALPPPPEGSSGSLSLRTPADLVADPVLRRWLEALQLLRRRASRTTPAVLLAEAVERLGVRATLSLRDPQTAAAADANLDVLLARAGRYGVRGLRQFAQDLHRDWSAGAGAREGQPEAGENAIEIVTVHRAKGREWPVVIPINGMGGRAPRSAMLHSSTADTLHWTLGDIATPDLAAALAAEAEAEARERARLLYVACTRAEDLLILPHVSAAGPAAYSRAADLDYDNIPELPLKDLRRAALDIPGDPAGAQDDKTFAAERKRVAGASKALRWRTPSEHDPDRLDAVEIDDAQYGTSVGPERMEGGRVRGLILHKLLEEVLSEDLAETAEALAERALRLTEAFTAELVGAPPDAGEIARTVLWTLALPEIARLRERLVPEVPVYGVVEGPGGEADAVAGRADAIAFMEGRAEAVIDWKSDVAPTAAETQAHVDQMRLYLAVTNAPLGLLVYMSSGLIRAVRRHASTPAGPSNGMAE
jgi:CRISPR-associated exonuclease Cas4